MIFLDKDTKIPYICQQIYNLPMTSKEKAKQIYDKMSDFTHGYVGSSMLSNTEFEDAKVKRTKEVAIFVANEVINTIGSPMFSEYDFWIDVKKELNNL